MESLPSKPKGILIINAHWETKDDINITAKEEHDKLDYDYEGFSPEAYQIKYYPPGDPNLSNRVKSLLDQAGIQAERDDIKVINHAVFFPLKLIYPAADIPIVSMSILDNLSPAKHIAIGKALSPLRKEEILIIGSSSVVHNHLREEHFIPLLIVAGVAGSDRGKLLNPNVEKIEAADKFGI